MSIDLSPQQLERLKGILALHLPSPIPVLVFGSRGNGEGKAHRASDIDIALISAERLPASVMTNLREAFAASDLPYAVDLVDWSATDKTFQQKILAAFTVLSPDFFISYTAPDLDWAQWLAYQLENAGYSTVLQAWDFKAGENFVERMHEAVRFSRFTVGVLSPNYLNSTGGRAEMQYALHQERISNAQKFIGVKVAICDSRELFEDRLYIDLTNKAEQAAKLHFVEGISKLNQLAFNKSISVHYPPDKPIWLNAPCVGEMSFPDWDANLHKGQVILQRAVNKCLLLITGVAGVDKSSFAKQLAESVAHQFDALAWVYAHTAETLSSNYSALAKKLDLQLSDNAGIAEKVEVVKHYVQNTAKVLLVFEDAQSLAHLQHYLPHSDRTGSLAIATSRGLDEEQLQGLEFISLHLSLDPITKAASDNPDLPFDFIKELKQ